MYYIKFIMKNNVIKLIQYLYYLSLTSLLIIYLFPGSLLGFFLYGDFGKQPDLIKSPVGNSINHFFYFTYLTGLAAICNLKQVKTTTNFIFIFFISIFLEISHLYIPNRAFELNDLISNIVGVFFVFIVYKIFR